MAVQQSLENKAKAPELSIVVPVFNEAANIAPLVQLVEAAFEDDSW